MDMESGERGGSHLSALNWPFRSRGAPQRVARLICDAMAHIQCEVTIASFR